MKLHTRRGLLKGFIALVGLTAFSRKSIAEVLTPRATEGPFYPSPSMRFADTDNNLIKVSGAVKKAGGEIIQLKGKILSKQGKPLADHRIEIWQCDVNGKYLHSGDGRNVVYDSGFQGFGHDITDKHGNYSFQTIKPSIYPGRTPHIHVKVLKGERELLTTQFYIAGDKLNSTDGLYRRMSDEEAQAVSMVFTQKNNLIETNINVIV